MHDVGTDEEWFEEQLPYPVEGKSAVIATNFRKPLKITEINQMADTPEVRVREGRP